MVMMCLLVEPIIDKEVEEIVVDYDDGGSDGDG